MLQSLNIIAASVSRPSQPADGLYLDLESCWVGIYLLITLFELLFSLWSLLIDGKVTVFLYLVCKLILHWQFAHYISLAPIQNVLTANRTNISIQMTYETKLLSFFYILTLKIHAVPEISIKTDLVKFLYLNFHPKLFPTSNPPTKHQSR